jgi:hypothetical protein
MAAAKQFTPPPNLTMTGPSERPNEPIQSGMNATAGAPVQRQVGSLSSMISAVASASGSSALSQLAARAAAAGQ